MAAARSPARGIVLAILAAALLARALAAAAYPPSDDLLGWRWVAAVLERGGDPYAETTRLNWPPLWLGWLELVRRLAPPGHGFDVVVRVLPTAADLAIAFLLARRQPLLGLAYALHPVALATTGAQAQLSSLPVLFVLLAVEACERCSGAVRAGLLLGLAAGFKTWPVVLAPALAASRASWRRRGLLVAIAVAVPAALLVPVWLVSADGFARNVLGYRSEPGWWGLTALGVLFGAAGRVVAAFAAGHAAALLVAALAAAWSVACRWRLGPNRAALVTVLAFLAATPGFGPQYLLWVVPLALIEGGLLAGVWQVLASVAVLVEFFVLPWIPLDPTRAVAERALLGNEMINWLRLPLWLLGIAWLGMLVARPASRPEGER